MTTITTMTPYANTLSAEHIPHAHGVSAGAIQYFKIVSRARNKYNAKLVISASTKPEDKSVCVREEDYGDANQLWFKMSMRGGNGYALVNKARGTCIARLNGNNGSPLELVSVTECAVNDLAVWRDDGVAGTYNAINSWADWEQKINIPGNAPYASGDRLVTWEWSRGANNELWVTVPDEYAVKLTEMKYSLDKLNLDDSEPLVAEWQILANDTDREQTQTLKVSFLDTMEYSFQSEKSTEITEGIEFSGGVPGLGKAKAMIEIKGTWKHATGTRQTRESEVALEVPVTVPARTTIKVSVIALRARIDVPYKATFVITYKDQQPIQQEVSGVFSSVNSYSVATRFEEIGKLAGDIHRRVL